MKNIFLVIAILVCAHPICAQRINSSFEFSDQSLEFANQFGGASMKIVTNSYKSERNSSDYIAETFKERYMVVDWAGMSADLKKGYISTKEGSKIKFQVLAKSKLGLVKLKLENYFFGPDRGKIVEFDFEITEIGKWQQASFDTSELESDYFNRIVLFFDFGSTDADVFYFDNLIVE